MNFMWGFCFGFGAGAAFTFGAAIWQLYKVGKR
jgi:hypothetical protein